LEGIGHIPVLSAVPACSELLWLDHNNCQYGRLGVGIRNSDFEIQVGSVNACVNLLCEVNNLCALFGTKKTLYYFRFFIIPKFGAGLSVPINHKYRVIVLDLTTCHTQYTADSSICIFYLIEEHSKSLLHTLQVLYMCTLCDSTNINTIIEFVPNCL